MSDEEGGGDEAEGQRAQDHGVTELKQPDTQQTGQLDQVQTRHLDRGADSSVPHCYLHY